MFILDEIDVRDLNSYTNIFAFETSVQKCPRTNQGSLGKDPSLWPKIPKLVPPTEAIDAL